MPLPSPAVTRPLLRSLKLAHSSSMARICSQLGFPYTSGASPPLWWPDAKVEWDNLSCPRSNTDPTQVIQRPAFARLTLGVPEHFTSGSDLVSTDSLDECKRERCVRWRMWDYNLWQTASWKITQNPVWLPFLLTFLNCLVCQSPVLRTSSSLSVAAAVCFTVALSQVSSMLTI